MIGTIESYAVVARVGARPRRVQHVERNGLGKSLCGLGPVIFVGEVEAPETDGWPWCEKCVDLAGPDVMEVWIDG